MPSGIYHNWTREQREYVADSKKCNMPTTVIARKLGIPKDLVYSEISIGKKNGVYDIETAENYLLNKPRCRKGITRNNITFEQYQMIEECLKVNFSIPEISEFSKVGTSTISRIFSNCGGRDKFSAEKAYAQRRDSKVKQLQFKLELNKTNVNQADCLKQINRQKTIEAIDCREVFKAVHKKEDENLKEEIENIKMQIELLHETIREILYDSKNKKS